MTVLNKIKIAGIGSYVPERIMTNFDFEKIVDTSDEWITTRTGIKKRHFASESEASSDFAIKASLIALKDAKMDPKDIDLVIVGTATPDMLFPSTACIVASALGCVNATAFDISAGCSGFVFSLSIAVQYLRTGHFKNALIIGTEALSKFLDFSNRETSVLFGDGAGAMVLRNIETDTNDDDAIVALITGSDGSGGNKLLLPAGGSRMPASIQTVKNHLHYVHMEGKEIFKFAVRISDTIVDTLLKNTNLTIESIDHYLFHQANIRILDSAVKRLNIPWEKVIVTIDEYGNTSSAAIPMALSISSSSGRIKKNDLILIAVFGAGLTWGGAILRWNKDE
ncbi:MAG: ketoacyl-ACP synthase III [Caldisericia bacterium]|nr:ketoacyl-ACP synthase III [Caldisericia bacterium]HOJ15854.1 beta-ketoacyl-ACP synthase III [Caldisericia bacterium]HOW02427.1 beta-ketoacyl-ACP synthase III [Caldisericia bacterium]HPO28917.1 beta-ketoacyl-ACP synthase III [Caldisericia bacterium]HQG81849.1 beta-ketoacyl-ACP synthase III [Caldisericia bacterium]